MRRNKLSLDVLIKKGISFFLISIICFLCSIKAKAQYIKAGFHDTADIYTDIFPDDSLNDNFGMSNQSDTLILDVDHDSHPDFSLNTNWFWAMGASYSGFTLSVIDTLNSFFLSQPDTCFVWGGTQKVYPVPVALNFGDSISSNLNFENDLSYFYSNGSGTFIYPTLTGWLGLGERYVGFKLLVPNDTLFGWIRLEVGATGLIGIKDYACNRNPNIIPVVPTDLNIYSLYPNPSDDFFTVNTDGLAGNLRLYSIQGALIKDISVATGQKNYVIETVTLPNGVYIITSKYSGVYYSNRLIVKHKK